MVGTVTSVDRKVASLCLPGLHGGDPSQHRGQPKCVVNGTQQRLGHSGGCEIALVEDCMGFNHERYGIIVDEY